MVNWWNKGRGRGSGSEPEDVGVEENVTDDAVEPSGEGCAPESDPEWVPNVSEVKLDIDGKEFVALSLYELPGLAVIEAQQTGEAERLPALWHLMQMALPQDGLDRMALLGFTEFQQVLFTWTMLSAQAAAEEYQKKGAEIVRKILGDEGAAAYERGDDPGEGSGPGRSLFG